MRRISALTFITVTTWLSLAALDNLASGEPQEAGRCYASPAAAIKSPPETLAYVVATYADTNRHKPDYLAVIDVDPKSKTYSQVVSRLKFPYVGDQLHHFGWNACGSCYGQRERRFLVIPGLVSSRIYIVDTANPRQPKLHRVIEPSEVIGKAKLTGPHTVHCLADGQIMISMLGNEKGEAPGGFLLLDDKFNVEGCWAASSAGMHFNYDFWYQPRQNVMISSEWAALNTVVPGFKLEEVKAGKYGHCLQFWDWGQKRIAQAIDLGEKGLLPLEVRFHHDPSSTHGFVGAALSSTIWHWCKDGDRWKADKVIEVPAQQVKSSESPLPGLITDVVLSMDDRWLYFSDWLHGDIRQYDVRDPSKPKLTGQVWLGGLLGKPSASDGKKLTGGPQMLQLSLDGRRLYVTNSLFSSWDNQFYPDIAKKGSWLMEVDCNTDQGGMTLNSKFFVDFGNEPDGPVRAHEIRFPYGDSTSDIWQ
jgi:selenium-binding protein 1